MEIKFRYILLFLELRGEPKFLWCPRHKNAKKLKQGKSFSNNNHLYFDMSLA